MRQPFGLGVEGRLRGCRVVLEIQSWQWSFLIIIIFFLHLLHQTHLGGGVNGVQGWVPPTGLRGVWVGLARGPCGWEGEPRPGPGQCNFLTSGAGALAKGKILDPCWWATSFCMMHILWFLSGGVRGVLCSWMRRCWGLFDYKAVSYFLHFSHIIFSRFSFWYIIFVGRVPQLI